MFALAAFVSHCLYYRLARTYDRSDDGRSDVIADLHFQQQFHTLHHGHLEETPPTGLRKRAPSGRQVCHSKILEVGRVIFKYYDQ